MKNFLLALAVLGAAAMPLRRAGSSARRGSRQEDGRPRHAPVRLEGAPRLRRQDARRREGDADGRRRPLHDRTRGHLLQAGATRRPARTRRTRRSRRWSRPRIPRPTACSSAARISTAPAQKYTYFIVRQDGKFMIKRRAGADTPTVMDWTDSAAIKKPDGGGKMTNTLAIEVGTDKVRFLVNGTEVTSVDAGEGGHRGHAGPARQPQPQRPRRKASRVEDAIADSVGDGSTPSTGRRRVNRGGGAVCRSSSASSPSCCLGGGTVALLLRRRALVRVARRRRRLLDDAPPAGPGRSPSSPSPPSSSSTDRFSR